MHERRLHEKRAAKLHLQSEPDGLLLLIHQVTEATVLLEWECSF
jgi:hypothetical protein